MKHRIRGDGWIRIDRVKARVLKATGGWYAVADPFGLWDARVLFRPVQDMVVIEQQARFLRIPFRAGEAMFEWDRRRYHVGPMTSGSVHIDQEGRVVARGVVTASGLRLDEVASELALLIRPLAWGLMLRGEDMAQDARRGDAGATAG